MRFLIPLVLVSLGVMIYALIECVRTPGPQVRVLPKPVWILAIIVIPLIGALLWLFFGPARQPKPLNQQPRPSSPDDDAEFLRRLDAQRRQKAREEELNRREQQLNKREDKLRSTDSENPAEGSNQSNQSGQGSTSEQSQKPTEPSDNAGSEGSENDGSDEK